MTIGQKLRELRIKAGLTQTEVAKKLGVATQTVFKYEKDLVQNIPASTVEKLAELFGSTPAALLGWANIGNLIPVKSRSYPLLGEISCGKPILAQQTFDTVAALDGDKQISFALRCKGDSMINARIFDGDVVFIREQDMVQNGEIAAVVIGDEATLKRVYFYPEENKIVLSAENPAYAPLVYEGEALSQIKIIGKAVAFQSNIR